MLPRFFLFPDNHRMEGKGERDMLKQQTGRSPSVGKAILSGTSTGAATAFLGAAVLAKLLDSEVMKMENVGYGILMIHLLAVFLGVKTTLGRAG